MAEEDLQDALRRTQFRSKSCIVAGRLALLRRQRQ
jgi:hypothetical protein